MYLFHSRGAGSTQRLAMAAELDANDVTHSLGQVLGQPRPCRIQRCRCSFVSTTHRCAGNQRSNGSCVRSQQRGVGLIYLFSRQRDKGGCNNLGSLKGRCVEADTSCGGSIRYVRPTLPQYDL